MTEADFWKSIKSGLDRFGSTMHATRIENAAGSGQPDVHVCYRGKRFWLELKVKRGRTIAFRAAQHGWLAKADAAGDKAFIVVRDGNSVRAYRARSGISLQLQDYPHTVAPDWSGNIPLDWEGFVAFLTSAQG